MGEEVAGIQAAFTKDFTWTSEDEDSIHAFAPHRHPIERPYQAVIRGAKVVNATCPCQGSDWKPPRTHSPTAVTWIDLRELPLSCAEAIARESVSSLRGEIARNIGFVVPDQVHAGSPKVQILGEPPVDGVTWYMSLSWEAPILKAVADRIDIADTFPLVEFPGEPGDAPQRYLLRHRELMDALRVRTERVLHVKPTHPVETFNVLSRAFHAVQAAGGVQKSAALTPGGAAPTIVAELLAGAASDALLVLPSDAAFGKGVTGCTLLRRLA